MQQGSIIIEIIKNIVTIAATVIAATVAVIGLKTWKKQLKGKTEYDLARRILIAIYKYRDALAIVRNPAIFVAETNEAIKEKENDKDFDVKDANLFVYSIRWRKVNEAYNALKVELLEAEALWGQEIKEVIKGILDCNTKLLIVVRRHITKRMHDNDDDILYGTYDSDDMFDKEVNVAVEKIETYLRKHLK